MWLSQVCIAEGALLRVHHVHEAALRRLHCGGCIAEGELRLTWKKWNKSNFTEWLRLMDNKYEYKSNKRACAHR
jgi:hypothetical protein